MSKAKQTLVEAFLERVSRGAVPIGGFYSIDPKDLRGHGENVTVAGHVAKGSSVTAANVTAANAAAHAEVSGASAPQPLALDVAAKAAGGRFAKWWPVRRTGELS